MSSKQQSTLAKLLVEMGMDETGGLPKIWDGSSTSHYQYWRKVLDSIATNNHTRVYNNSYKSSKCKLLKRIVSFDANIMLNRITTEAFTTTLEKYQLNSRRKLYDSGCSRNMLNSTDDFISISKYETRNKFS
jgi:hypothetical protein